MKKNIDVKKLLLCVLLPLAGGIAVGLLIRDGTDSYTLLTRPPLAPPSALFPIVWTVLYILMGLSLYGVLSSDAPQGKKQAALRTFTSQLLLNYLWPIIFFVIQTYWAAVVCLVLLIVFVIKMYIQFRAINKPASALLLPYIVWIMFALYLNVGTAILN